VQTLKFLAQAQRAGQERVNRLQMPARTANEALEALYRYTLHLLQQDIHSWKCLRALHAEPPPRARATPRRGGTESA
jgi:DNA repair protein RecO (recombination protein O)